MQPLRRHSEQEEMGILLHKEEWGLVKLWIVPICAVLTGERDPSPAAQPLPWSWVHLEGPACLGHKSSGYLQAGLQRGIRLLSSSQ